MKSFLSFELTNLFVDTSAWCALSDRNDQNHKKASDFLNSLKGKNIKIITSDYIFDESVTLLRAHISHSSSVDFGNSLLRSDVIIHSIDRDIWIDAWNIFVNYSDQHFSFTDCSSFALMKKLNIRDAFTFDHHFRIIGFNCHPL